MRVVSEEDFQKIMQGKGRPEPNFKYTVENATTKDKINSVLKYLDT